MNEESIFKVGDWVTRIDDDENSISYGKQLIYQVSDTYLQDYPNIKAVPRMIIDGCNYDNNDKFWELWKPKVGEWCWYGFELVEVVDTQVDHIKICRQMSDSFEEIDESRLEPL